MSTNLALQLQEFRKRQASLSAQTAADKAKKPKAAPQPKREAKPLDAKPEFKFDAKAAARRGGPLLALVKKVVDCLFHAQKPLKPMEVTEKCGVEILGDKELFDVLKENPKVEYSDETATLVYSTSYSFKGRRELMDFLLRQPEGTLQSDISDAYPGAAEDIKALHKERKVWVLTNSRTSEQIVYPVDPKFDLVVEASVVERWAATEHKIPKDQKDLDDALKAAKITPCKRSGQRRRPPDPKEKKRKQREARFRKVTNAHMPELFQAGADAPPAEGF